MRQALTFLFVMALAGAAYYLLTPDGRHFIDRVYINWMRAEHQHASAPESLCLALPTLPV